MCSSCRAVHNIYMSNTQTIAATAIIEGDMIVDPINGNLFVTSVWEGEEGTFDIGVATTNLTNGMVLFCVDWDDTFQIIPEV